MRWSIPWIVLIGATTGCYLEHARAAGDTGGIDAGGPVGCASDGARCDDTDPCTEDDTCLAGRCVGRPRVCRDGPACHAVLGQCAAGRCEYRPLSGWECDDGDACTDQDTCEAGRCVGMPRVCASPEPSICLNPTYLRESLAPGECMRGECVYPTFERPCPDGCVMGACDCVARPWRSELIDEAGDVGRYNALAVDAAGGVHVAYYLAPLPADLRYAFRAPGGSWTTEDVDVAADVGGSPSIAIDSSGRAHAVYDDLTALGLRYAAQRVDGTWRAEPIVGGGRAWGGSVGLGPEDALHVAYTMETDGFETHLRYATRRPDGSWVHTTVSAGAQVGVYPSLALDARGGVHIVHLDVASRALRHAYRAPGAADFSDSAIDESGDVVGGNAVAVDRTGGLHVGYFRQGGSRLMHAFRAPDGTWMLEPVEGASHARWNVGVGVDADDTVHLLFDSDRPDLFHARRARAGAWTVERVASTGFSLSFLGGAALAVDARGDAHVTHYDERGRALRYATRRLCDP